MRSIESIDESKVNTGQTGPMSQPAAAFNSPTAEVLAQKYPATERATLYVLATMVVIAGIFISLAKIERVVPTVGRLVPTTGAITVQPLQTQLISRILVSVGEIVKKGQILATCDPTFVDADRIRLEQQLSSIDAQIRRMEAEANGLPFLEQSNKPYDILQRQIFAERQSGYRSSLEDFSQRISSAQSQINGLQQNITDYKSRLRIASEMEGMHISLAKDGYVSRLQLLTVQDQQVDLKQKLSDTETNLIASQHTLQSLREQRKTFIDKYRDDELNAIVSARNAQDSALQDLSKANKSRELVNLIAPEDSIVTRIPALGAGNVAASAQPLFNLVPLEGRLEAQVQIDAQDIGFVKVGDPVTIKLDAFKFLEHGTGKGFVKTVSQDSFSEASMQDSASAGVSGMQGHPAYFDARIAISDLHLHNVPPAFRLTPGMTIAADIVVGRRSILWYLVGGRLQSGAEAMREP